MTVLPLGRQRPARREQSSVEPRDSLYAARSAGTRSATPIARSPGQPLRQRLSAATRSGLAAAAQTSTGLGYQTDRKQRPAVSAGSGGRFLPRKNALRCPTVAKPRENRDVASASETAGNWSAVI
jgi:hypothetical protein